MPVGSSSCRSSSSEQTDWARHLCLINTERQGWRKGEESERGREGDRERGDERERGMERGRGERWTKSERREAGKGEGEGEEGRQSLII